MNRSVYLATTSLFLSLSLGACSHDPAGVRITNEGAAPAVVQAAPRAEPVFYNGKTYQVSFAADPAGGYAVTIAGMSAAQGKDASAVGTSSLRHFACKSSQTAKLIAQPSFAGQAWHMTAHCA